MRILFLLLIIINLLIPYAFARAASLPNYVGIEEGDEIIWNTTFDAGPIEDWLEDLGFSQDYIDNYTDIMFDDESDEDVIQWKWVILDFREEKDDTYEHYQINYIKYEMNAYIKEKGSDSDWKIEEKSDTGTIYRYRPEFYADRVFTDMGLFYGIAADNINWKSLEDELEEEWEEDYGDDADVSKVRSEGLGDDFIGISTSYDPGGASEEWSSKSTYNQYGVLQYYEWKYDGDIIFKFELQESFWTVYWWLILIIALIGVAVVVTLIILLLTRKKPSTTKQKKPTTAAPVQATSEVKEKKPSTDRMIYCGNCGAQIASGSKFCTECGSEIKD